MNGRLLETLESSNGGHSNWVMALMTDTKKHLVSSSRDQTVKMWSIKRKRLGSRKPSKCITTIELEGVPQLMRMNERREVFVATSSNVITSYSISGKKLCIFEGHTGKIRGILFRQAALYTASADGTLRK
jgi:WD40 repeat protein